MLARVARRHPGLLVHRALIQQEVRDDSAGTERQDQGFRVAHKSRSRATFGALFLSVGSLRAALPRGQHGPDRADMKAFLS